MKTVRYAYPHIGCDRWQLGLFNCLVYLIAWFRFVIITCKQLILYVIVCPIFFVAAKLIGQQESFEFSFRYTGRNFVNTWYTNSVNV